MARFGLRARDGGRASGDIGGKRAWHFDSENAAGEERGGGRGNWAGRVEKATGKDSFCPLHLSSECTPMSHFLNVERAKLFAGKRRMTFQRIAAVFEARMWTH